MTRRPLRGRPPARFIATALALAAATAPAALAADVTPASCEFTTSAEYTICTVTTNRLLMFTAKGGELVGGAMEKTATRDIRGYITGGSPKDQPIARNGSAWDSFYRNMNTTSGSLGPSAKVTFRATTGPLADHRLVMDTDFSEWWKLGATGGTFTPSCPDAGYYACFLPQSYSHGETTRQPDAVTAYASIESRPLIVKVLNMTDQPLVRSTEARGTGAIRDTQVADPEVVGPIGPKGPGVGYYHYYRATESGSSVTASYTMQDAPGATSLTGSVVDINIAVSADGKTDLSGCTVPDGGAVTISCSVTMLGMADGVLSALVAVGV